MPTNYDQVDLEFSWNGDLLVGKDGDLSDTSSDKIQSLVQEVQSVVASSLYDWQENPGIGSNLDEFVGEPNNRDTANNIRDRIISALILSNIVLLQDLEVRVIPVGIYSVMAIINIKALATAENSLGANSFTITLVFDYMERGIFFVDSSS